MAAEAAAQATIILSLILWLKVILNSEAEKKSDRAIRINSNDQENIPYVMVLAWGALFSMVLILADRKFFIAHIVLYTLFVIARIFHTIIYSPGLSLSRGASFFVNMLSAVGIVINALIALFDTSPEGIGGTKLEAMQAMMILSLILWLKVIFSNAGAPAPEDFYQANQANVTVKEVEALDRAKRVVLNDQENIPYVMVLAWGALFTILLVNASNGYLIAHIVLYNLFVSARILHTIVYLRAFSLSRTIFFLIGLLSSISMVLNSLILLIGTKIDDIKLHEAIKATMILSLILWLKVIFSNLYLGRAKQNAGARAPEDLNRADQANVSEESLNTLDRANRIISNDQENIPYVMVLAWAALLINTFGVAKGNYFIAHIVMYTIFVTMRVLHTLVYSYGLSVPRTVVFLVGSLSSLGIVINAMIPLFERLIAVFLIEFLSTFVLFGIVTAVSCHE